MPAGKFWYNDGTYNPDAITGTFGWKNPPFGGAGDDNTAIYNYDLTLADSDGMYKLWRDGAGGWYTVETECGPRGFECSLVFTCRPNDSWDDLSDEC